MDHFGTSDLGLGLNQHYLGCAVEWSKETRVPPFTWDEETIVYFLLLTESVSDSPLETENSHWSSSPRQLVVGFYFFFASINNNNDPRSAAIIDAVGNVRLCGLWDNPWLTPYTPKEFPRSNGACFVSQTPLIKTGRTLGATPNLSQFSPTHDDLFVNNLGCCK